METLNCMRCKYRHEDNGNCTDVGGFCTAVTAAHCPLLRKYLDTGMTPELCAEFARADAEGRYIVMRDAEQEGVARLRELAEADKDGRLVVLPCKVGDTVYFRTYDCNGKVDLGIQPHKVTAIVGSAIVRGGYIDIGLLLGQYGVSWFLTREEADEALEAMKNE